MKMAGGNGTCPVFRRRPVITGFSKKTGMATTVPETMEEAWAHHLEVWHGCTNFRPGDSRSRNAGSPPQMESLFDEHP
jgi:hypothetical protein